ncbi:MAG: hypothetical protein PHI98_17185 [Eubacteriales bacterium]|nr:hypothetical protein [Eubacteriales bacterium]
MAGVTNKVKLTFLKGMEAIGQSASNLASNAQQKLQELNLENQRREILTDFPLRAYDLWQKGEVLPDSLSQMLKELSELDERLGVLRAQRYAKVESEQPKGEESAAEGTDETATESEAPQTAPDSEESTDDHSADEAKEEPMDEGETGDNA